LWVEYTLPAVALVITGVQAILEGSSVHVLPETLGHKLLNTVVDTEMLGRNKHQIQNKLKKNIGTLQFLCFENWLREI
jgi:hypothetical protein